MIAGATPVLADVLDARRLIAGTAVRTPLVPSSYMSRITGDDFLLKLEIGQPTGAFKLRGAANAVFRLPADAKGVVCCSTGNHGRAMAYAAAKRGLKAVVCMSSLVPRAKVEGIKALGAEVVIIGKSQDDALAESRRLCKDGGLTEIPPFDDPHVIAGQGTIALEMLEDRPDLATLLVPLSGGGLAAGVALAAKSINRAIKVIGISMDRGAAMSAALDAGKPVDVQEVASLADSLGGGIGLENRLTFNMCRDLMDAVVLVEEADIYRAMQALYYEDRLVAEGASVVGLAAILAGKLKLPKGPAATIITGRNTDMPTFTNVITGKDVTLGDVTVKGEAYVA
jgi:threonine dehydratase